MDGNSLIQVLITVVSYYFFSREFFKFSAEIRRKPISGRLHFACFFFVYLWFFIASCLELPLVVNWFIFLILLGLEVRLAFSFDLLVSYGLALFCAIMGLAVNVFFRSLVSILLNIPISTFDNALSSIKSFPIFLGFTTMVFLMYGLRRGHFSSRLERMMRYRKSLVFYTWTEVFIYLFLMIQLLAYSQSGNEMGIKTWGIKSAVFSIFVLVITIIYSLRVASLHYYMEKQHEIRSRLILEKQDINKLWKLAYTDMLTGLNNRQLFEKRLEEYAGYGSCITLSFMDVNGLKATNDQFGHLEGDAYLIDVSRILSKISGRLNMDLFRYGGDEFVMMGNGVNGQELAAALEQANEQLKSGPARYPRSISYGVVRGDCTEYPSLIAEADHQMYRYKLKHYERTARS